MSIYRWKFLDNNPEEGQSDSYEFDVNPKEMQTLNSEKKITVLGTTAVDGQALLYEGARPPQAWEFSGTLLTKDQYDQMNDFFARRHRLQLMIHDGRLLDIYATGFSPVPKPSTNYRWRHEYTFKALVFKVTPATGDPGAYGGTGGTTGGGSTGGSTGGTTGTTSSGAYTVTFVSPSLTWTIVHSLDHTPIVETVDASGNVTFGSVSFPDDTHVVIHWSAPTSGRATLV